MLESGFDAELLIQLVVEDAAPWAVGLKPLAIENQLGNGALAHVPQDLVRRAGNSLDVDFGKDDLMRVQVALRLPAIAAPRRGIHENFHAHHSSRRFRGCNVRFWS